MMMRWKGLLPVVLALLCDVRVAVGYNEVGHDAGVFKLRANAFPKFGNPFSIKARDAEAKGGNRIVCYMTGSPASWLRNDSSVLHPADVPDGACDVINLMNWLDVDAENLTLRWKEDEFDWMSALRTMLRIKGRSANDLKLMVTVGGGNDPDDPLSGLVVSPDRKRVLETFAHNARAFLLYSGLDGLDIDWEFPAWKRPWQQRPGFEVLLAKLRSSFDEPPWKGRLYLSVAVAAVEGIIDAAYTVPRMARRVDWVNLMAYDYHGFVWYLPFTGHNAPLLPRANERGSFGKLNVRWSVERWLALGMPPEKLYVGIPTYGRNYKLLTPEVHDVGAVATSGGWVGYLDACRTVSSPDGHGVWDDEARVPYAYRGSDWISYDDVRSVREKLGLVGEFGLGGAMVFSLDADDYRGDCVLSGNARFPLLNAVARELHRA